MQGFQDFRRIAVYCEQLEGEFGVPCGACRQFLCEFNPEIPFYLVRKDMKVRVGEKIPNSKRYLNRKDTKECSLTLIKVKETSLAKLLPDSFTPKRLNLHFHNK